MYYLVKGKSVELDGETWDFEWILEAENEEGAKAQLNENEKCVEIKSLTVEECIEREKNDIQNSVINEYLNRKYWNASIKEYSQAQKELKNDPKKYYEMLKECNKSLRFEHRLLRCAKDKDISLKDFILSLNAMINAKTEEEIISVINKIKEENKQ